jgi:ribose 5-phosphate isomerase B
MKVYLATDHAGFTLKEAVKAWLMEAGVEVMDYGAYGFDDDDDYPDYISLAAVAVSRSPHDRAIIFGGSGQGEAMLANRYPAVRAAVYYGGPLELVTLSREHNDANVLSLGARFVEPATAIEAVDVWLKTAPLNDSKYQRRVKKAETLSLRG